MLSKSPTLETWLLQHQPDPPISIPELHRQQMHLLSEEQHRSLTKEVQQQKLFGTNSCSCLGVKRFPKMQSRRLEDDRSDEYCREVRQWLYECGIPFRTIVNIYYDNETIRSTWKLLIRYWPLFYSNGWDDVLIVDHTYQWALSLCHHSIWTLGRYSSD